MDDVDELCRNAFKARCVILLLSRGSLESEEQLQVIGEIIMHGAPFPALVPVHLPGFEFPSEPYFKEILPKVWPGSSAEMRSCLQGFFNRISLRFSTEASEVELSAQAQRVLDRIPEDFVETCTSSSRLTMPA